MSSVHLEGISLQNFRSYSLKTFLFPKQTTVILGKNAAGKTSLIEAVALLSTGESFRAEQVSEMISFDEELGRVKGKVVESGENGEGAAAAAAAPQNPTDLEVVLTRGLVGAQKTPSKMYFVNSVKRMKKNFIGTFFTVVFRPEDLRLIEGSPARRRQFIDTILTVTDPEYAFSLKTYEESLKRRNRLLFLIKDGRQPKSVLSFWTTAILKHGAILQEKRRDFFGTFSSVEFPVSFTLMYQASVMSEARMEEYAEREVAAGHTLIGPHKDDFVVEMGFGGAAKIEKQNLAVAQFGSRGQQRLAALWLKMCELTYLQNTTHTQPILLLDDVLSELDLEHRHDVFSLLPLRQSLITTTEERMVEEIRQRCPDLHLIEL